LGHTSAIDEIDGFQQALVNVPKYGDVEHHMTKTAVSVGDEIFSQLKNWVM